MTRDPEEKDRLLAKVQAIFDRRGLTTEEQETVVALLTKLLLDGLDPAGPSRSRVGKVYRSGVFFPVNLSSGEIRLSVSAGTRMRTAAADRLPS